MNSETAVNLFFGTATMLLILFLGIIAGRVHQQELDITKYCLYQEYEGLTEIDNIYYCYDGDSLFKVEWVE